MTLPSVPIITKFFANKIESSNSDWADYLLEVANIFAEFDGEDFDREWLLERFRVISDRSPYSLRDPSNFRDEFGAYGPYLGVYHIEKSGDCWRVVLSGATRHYLCTPEPDVEAFCRSQLALFQYPNGAGAVYRIMRNGSLSIRVQANLLNDTIREVRYGLRLVPFRLICKALFAKSTAYNIGLEDVSLLYKEIFALFNDTRTSTNPNPAHEDIVSVLEDVRTDNCQQWVSDPYLLGKFKRNFHIFEHTGLIQRTISGVSLRLDNESMVDIARAISDINTYFTSFDLCNGDSGCIASVIKSDSWGKYYDAANLSANLLSTLTEDVTGFYTSPSSNAISHAAETADSLFPSLTSYEGANPSHRRVNVYVAANPEITRIKKEKANRDHARLVERFSSLARLAGGEPYENLFVDLFVELNDRKYIFEMKSCNPSNLLGQVRKGISQLYEYRYRSGHSDALLCLVLQNSITDRWLIDYLVRDRQILVCWLVDEVSTDCPPKCRDALAPFLT